MKILNFIVALIILLSLIPTSNSSKSQNENNLIEIYPTCIANQTPFLIKIKALLEPNTTYKFSAYIYGGSSVISKIWNDGWKGGYNYKKFTTNETGYFEKWIHLKVIKEPENSYNYYLTCKIKNDTETIKEQKISKDSFKIIENFGWIEGYISKDFEALENKIVIVKNETNAIVGISSTENNNVDDFLLQRGCFNVSAPPGKNYTIFIQERNGTVIENITNVSVEKNKTTILNKQPKREIVINEIMYYPKEGEEWIELYNNCSYSVNITDWVLTDQDGDNDFVFPNLIFPKNSYILIYTGRGINETDFSDNLTRFYMWKNTGICANIGDDVLLLDDLGNAIDYVAYGSSDKPDSPPNNEMWDGSWNGHIGKDNPSAMQGHSIARYPNGWDNDSVENWIEFESPTVGKENKKIPIIFEPDLIICSIEIENKNNIFEGDIIKIKSQIKNNGTKDATEFEVSFYLDKIDNKHLIASKTYSSLLHNYYKYPSIEFDTLNHAGNHSIIIKLDTKAEVIESNETNNIAILPIYVIPTPPTKNDYSIMITEICYDTYSPNDSSEFIKIHNPLSINVNISGWQLTDKEGKSNTYEGTITFPNGTILYAFESIYVTKNAQAFYEEMGIYPDFEYENSLSNIKKMNIIEKTPKFANHGDEVILKDEHRHIIDVAVYGDSNYKGEGWSSLPIEGIMEGEILKRNIDEITNNYVDTNTSLDWQTPRIYKVGQSNFEYETFEFIGIVKTFVSPDSSFNAIIKEINSSKNSIYLNVYEFTNPYLMDALINAKKRGVEVKVFLEGSPVKGISETEKYIAYNLWKNNIEVRFLISDSKNNIHSRYSYLHAKYCVIDNFSTTIMSENWELTGVPINNTFGNRGWGIIIYNIEVGNYFANVFFHDWNPKMKDSFLFDPNNSKYGKPSENFIMERIVPNGSYKPKFDSKEIKGSFKISPIISPDTTLLKENSIIKLLNSAKKSIYIEQIICKLDWSNEKKPLENLYLQAVIDAARRGCEVKILLDSRYVNMSNDTDNYDVVNYINNLAKKEGLKNLKAKLIYLGNLSKLHSKGLIVDDNKTLISSINWGRGSVIKNREVGVIVENEDVAKYFKDVFFYDWNLKNEKINKEEEKEESNESNEENQDKKEDKGKNNEKRELPKWAIFLIFILLIFIVSIGRDLYYKKK